MRYEIDIHGMTIIEAKIYITQMLEILSKDYSELVVVHGYHGKQLLNFVRNQYKHKRIERKMLCMNPGQTILLLKKN